MAGIARGDRERPVSGLVRATDGAVARRPAEMAKAHGDAANPVGALENRPEQAGLGVLQVAAQGVGARGPRSGPCGSGSGTGLDGAGTEKRLGLGALDSEGRAAWRLSADASKNLVRGARRVSEWLKWWRMAASDREPRTAGRVCGLGAAWIGRWAVGERAAGHGFDHPPNEARASRERAVFDRAQEGFDQEGSRCDSRASMRSSFDGNGVSGIGGTACRAVRDRQSLRLAVYGRSYENPPDN